ncbi:hypothetical protein HYW54_02015 [Candidatus Gottesmanbacteria bacterium]|nr:hypothetical protein [Candidatus Gottesmanbacteria bacterium]
MSRQLNIFHSICFLAAFLVSFGAMLQPEILKAAEGVGNPEATKTPIKTP